MNKMPLKTGVRSTSLCPSRLSAHPGVCRGVWQFDAEIWDRRGSPRMERSPLVQVVKQLAQMQESYNQALCSLQDKRDQAMQAIATLQAADRPVLMELLREISACPNLTPPLAHIRLQKMGLEEDPEALLELFEQTARACNWLVEEWADNTTLRETIGERVGLRPKGHRKRPRELVFAAVGWPFAYAAPGLPHGNCGAGGAEWNGPPKRDLWPAPFPTSLCAAFFPVSRFNPASTTGPCLYKDPPHPTKSFNLTIHLVPSGGCDRNSWAHGD